MLYCDTAEMRSTDIARLCVPYSEDCSSNDPDANAMAAMEMDLRECRRLECSILADFAEEPPFGIGWWAPSPGTSRRILIANQLYACARSVPENMLEAALHWLEFLDYEDRESARFANAVHIESGQLHFSIPRPHTSLEHLSSGLVKIHLVGLTARWLRRLIVWQALSSVYWVCLRAFSKLTSTGRAVC